MHRPLPALSLVTLLSACGAPIDAWADDEDPGISAESLSSVTTYAPLVYLHSQEAYRPMSASTFLASSRLRWSHDAGCPDDQFAGVRQINARSLGSGAYRHQITDDFICSHHGAFHPSSQRTRPRDGDTDTEGFFLDLENSARGGAGTAAPVYYEYLPGKSITYWFLYGYSVPPAPSLIAGHIAHEGDWERVSLRLDAGDRPTDVAFYAHNGYCTRPWSAVAKSGTHPIVYSGKGSHASYPTPGDHAISFLGLSFSDKTDAGTPWRTWGSLYNARAQGWFGFGGAWGEVGELKDTTGPLGPSPYKGAAPTDWSKRCD